MAQTLLNDKTGVQYTIECFDLKIDRDNFILANGNKLQNVISRKTTDIHISKFTPFHFLKSGANRF